MLGPYNEGLTRQRRRKCDRLLTAATITAIATEFVVTAREMGWQRVEIMSRRASRGPGETRRCDTIVTYLQLDKLASRTARQSGVGQEFLMDSYDLWVNMSCPVGWGWEASAAVEARSLPTPQR